MANCTIAREKVRVPCNLLEMLPLLLVNDARITANRRMSGFYAKQAFNCLPWNVRNGSLADIPFSYSGRTCHNPRGSLQLLVPGVPVALSLRCLSAPFSALSLRCLSAFSPYRSVTLALLRQLPDYYRKYRILRG
jgi:hypothetical protein